MTMRHGDLRESSGEHFDPMRIQRPDARLLYYYLTVSLLTGPAFPFVFIPLFIRYHTLRYEIDDEGVRMSWGFLFRREIILTYRRIQDIHVRRNVVHRWFGLAVVALQTASGTAGAEMSIEGILEPERLRDFLYQKMRGARGLDVGGDAEGATRGEAAVSAGEADEVLVLLREIRDLLRAPAAPGDAT